MKGQVVKKLQQKERSREWTVRKKKKAQKVVFCILLLLDICNIVFNILTTTSTRVYSPGEIATICSDIWAPFADCICAENSTSMHKISIGCIVVAGVAMTLEIVNAIMCAKKKKKPVVVLSFLAVFFHFPAFIMNIIVLGKRDSIFTRDGCPYYPSVAFPALGLVCGLLAIVLSIIFLVFSAKRVGASGRTVQTTGTVKTAQVSTEMAAPNPAPAGAPPAPNPYANPYAAPAPNPYATPAPNPYATPAAPPYPGADAAVYPIDPSTGGYTPG